MVLCDRCKEKIKPGETTYTVQYKSKSYIEEICRFCFDKDFELFNFIELGFMLNVSIPK